MSSSDDFSRCARILVVIPNWVGDVVLATPVLAALREHFSGARIAYLMKPYVADVLAGGGWHDDELFWSARGGVAREVDGFSLVRRVKSCEFELAVLLTNSFRSAALVWMARVPRRVGFARDARGWMLTHRLAPRRENGEFTPFPVTRSYAQIAERVGCDVSDQRLRLGVTAQQEQATEALKRAHGLDDGQPYAVINPGAAFGAAKCWPEERFAAVCDGLTDRHGYRCLIVGAPNESPLMRRIARAARVEVVCCEKPGTTLGSLKALIRDAVLLICNDTGPRHYGNAFGVPTLTIFGPTHPAWTDGAYPAEVKLQVAVECGPCQLRTCPIDHRCMTRITSEMVLDKIAQLAHA